MAKCDSIDLVYFDSSTRYSSSYLPRDNQGNAALDGILCTERDASFVFHSHHRSLIQDDLRHLLPLSYVADFQTNLQNIL